MQGHGYENDILFSCKLNSFYKIGFVLTFCKVVYKVNVFGIWIWPTCSAKALWKKKYRSALGNAQLLTSNSPNYTVNPMLL